MGIYIIYGIVVAIPALLVLVDAKFSSRKLIPTARKWQTLIGATLGFLALSYSLILQDQLQQGRESRVRHQEEKAIVDQSIVDIDRSIASINTLAEVFAKDKPKDAYECGDMLKIIQTHPLSSLLFWSQSGHWGSELSASSYTNIYGASYALRLMRTSLLDLDMGDCKSKHGDVTELVLNILSSTKTALLKYRGALSAQSSALSN